MYLGGGEAQQNGQPGKTEIIPGETKQKEKDSIAKGAPAAHG